MMEMSLLGVPSQVVQDTTSSSDKSLNESSDSSGKETKYKCTITSERLAFLRKSVDDAIKDHRIFMIKGGWQTLRKCFLKRNWIEKFDLSKNQRTASPHFPPDEICNNLPSRLSWETPTAHIFKCERTIMSRLLQLYDEDFYWNTRRDQSEMQIRMKYNKLVNRFSRSLFNSKEGLCLLLQQMYWYNESGTSAVNFPRCYVLGFPDHFNSFVEDFRLTACMSFLKFVIDKFQRTDNYAVQSPEGEVPYSAYQFALNRVKEFIAQKNHLDIDMEIPQIEKSDWDGFLKHFQLIVNEDKFFRESDDFNIIDLVGDGTLTLKKLKPHWPQVHLDGMKNIWIIKPGNKCRGRGIQLVKDVKDVERIMDLKLKFVVQKYIERPLIIHNTKFDIRQWFLITSVQPLIIWMYRDSYLRFSSQTFNLDNFHESLHLTNYAVQCKYKNTDDRHEELPDENMWDSNTFKEYLVQIGQENKWDMVIFPGMREAIVGTMLACQDTMDRRPNTFELYGADFILDEYFTPWLLEINSSPDFSSSTSVTARMCPQCLEDLVKVVIDRRKDPTANTGLFDLIYKQNIPRIPTYLGMSLSLRGRRCFKRSTRMKRDKENDSTKKTKPPKLILRVNPNFDQTHSGPMISDLIEDIHKEIEVNEGIEILSPIPVKIEKKKTVSKRESRVSRLASIKSNKTNHANCSSTVKTKLSANWRMPRTAPPPRSLKSNFPRGNFGLYNEWSLGHAKISQINNNDDDEWKKDAVSILKGKNLFKRIIKGSHQSCFLNQSKYRVGQAKEGESSLGETRKLLTVGCGLGMKILCRPHT